MLPRVALKSVILLLSARGWKDEKCKSVLSYTVALSDPWDTMRPVSKKKERGGHETC